MKQNYSESLFDNRTENKTLNVQLLVRVWDSPGLGSLGDSTLIND